MRTNSIFGIYLHKIERCRAAFLSGGASVRELTSMLFQGEDGKPDGFVVACLDALGLERFAESMAHLLPITSRKLEDGVRQFLASLEFDQLGLRGADAIALLLDVYDFKLAFAYPGTSELVLCASVARTSSCRLVNSRGDKEAVFCAAGASLSRTHAIAILHGARGSTNALGAIASVRRNEISSVCIVGLPSTSSERFLPPHGELNLIDIVVPFARAGGVAPAPLVNKSLTENVESANEFIDFWHKAFGSRWQLPAGPFIAGIPQDTAESCWIPYSSWRQRGRVVVPQRSGSPAGGLLEAAARLIRAAEQITVLVDDYFWRVPASRSLISNFAKAANGIIFQVGYRRGAMLFEQITGADCDRVRGPYLPLESEARARMDASKLLVTVEDRNAYPRVVGRLPSCPKIAVTSNAQMTKKNEYLSSNDILLEGDVGEILTAITNFLSPTITVSPNVLSEDWDWLEHDHSLGGIFCEEFERATRGQMLPCIVDDSQTFGGMLARHYRYFPRNLRVYGDHSGFVGAGIGYAVGVALGDPESSVWCLTGDQGFLNGCQALASAGESNCKLIIIVCNNGGSVSLLTELRAKDESAFLIAEGQFLGNGANVNVLAIAQGFGIDGVRVPFLPENPSESRRLLRDGLKKATDDSHTFLVELCIPYDLGMWEGHWAIDGLENR